MLRTIVRSSFVHWVAHFSLLVLVAGAHIVPDNPLDSDDQNSRSSQLVVDTGGQIPLVYLSAHRGNERTSPFVVGLSLQSNPATEIRVNSCDLRLTSLSRITRRLPSFSLRL